MIEIPVLPAYILRFFAGSVGTFTYFFCTVHAFGVPQLERDELNDDNIVKNMRVRSTFIIIGGLVASFTNTDNLLICFVEGVLLRRLILAVFESKSRLIKNIIENYFLKE